MCLRELCNDADHGESELLSLVHNRSTCFSAAMLLNIS